MKTTVFQTKYTGYDRLVLSLLAVLMFASTVFSAQLTGRDVIQRVRDRDTGQDSKGIAKMTIINSSGQQRVRTTLRFTMEISEDLTKSLIYFLAPADIKGTSFLTYDYDDSATDDDQWLYLPALGKVKRIVSSNKGDSFMGSDFAYEDMTTPAIDEYTYKMLGQLNFAGYQCYQVEATPKPETDTSYSKRIMFVDKNTWVPIRIDFYDENGKFLKRMLVGGLKQINGIWTVTKNMMSNVQEGSKTIIEMQNVQYNIGLKESFFTEEEMKVLKNY